MEIQDNNKHPDIYIIVPVHNRINFTRQCLQCLENQSYRDAQVILVDDGSTDGTYQLVREQFPWVEILLGDGNLWWLGAVNLALQLILKNASANDLVLLLNNDLQFDNDYVERLLKVHIKYPDSIIGSVESNMSHPGQIVKGGIQTNWWTAKGRRLNSGRCLSDFPPGHLEETSYVTGRGVLIPVKIFFSIGLYNPKYVHMGDFEFGVRAKKKGYKLYISYDLVVYNLKNDDKGINRDSYKISDFFEYLFDERSYANIKNIYLNALLCTKNPGQALCYFVFSAARITGHFLKNLSIFHNKTKVFHDSRNTTS